MQSKALFFFLLLNFSAILAGGLAIYTWRKRHQYNVYYLPFLLLTVSYWTFFSGIELVAKTLWIKEVLTTIYYVGIISIPVLFLLFASEYRNATFYKKPFWRYGIWVVPAISVLLLFTNSLHGLFFKPSTLELFDGIPVRIAEYGAWWWVHLLYSYILLVFAIAQLVRILLSSSTGNNRQVYLLLFASLVPIVSNILYVFAVRPLGFIDLTPVAFTITSTLFVLGISLGDIMLVRPVALRVLFDSLPDGIVVLDKNCNIIDANPMVKELVDDKSGITFASQITSSFIVPLNIKNVDSLNVEMSFNGNEYNVVLSPLIQSGTSRIGKLLLIRNISESLKAQKELTTAQSRLQLAAKVAGIDPWENNLVTGEAIGGEQIYFELGYNDTEIPKTISQIYDIVHPDDLPDVKLKLSDHLEGKTNFYTSDFRMRNKWGEYRWVANFGMVIERTESGDPLRLVGLTMNINERKRIEEKIRKQNEELLKTNAEKDKFFSIIAHDLRGPFQGFIGLTEVLTEQGVKLTHEEFIDLAKTLQTTAKNIYELLENLLGWAMIKRGTKKFTPEKLRLLPNVKSVLDLLKPQIVAKRHTVNLSVNTETELLADRESVRTIFRNIISNAIKFTPEGGEIKIIENKSEKGFVLIGIADNGIGMPTEIRENLFKLNVKVSRHGTNNEPSTGLGLILCKELIEKHGGEIWVESESNSGSTFWFTLPVSG
jgi:PAS domain S-box-containing protein